MLISFAEYARIHGKETSSVRRMALRGRFKTAVKIGKVWAIDDQEPYPDNRVKSGQYRDWRKPKDKS
ncbi:hypothetical protein [Ruthenibacterium lactatiformans]|uniref:hypothetical protein n=1 Tax=Ruthenibacterium lactatiformans TaxID=1550024 RepID=UPI002673D507|nr:hypothetical protein [Ruthenibacterium lactatiformans]